MLNDNINVEIEKILQARHHDPFSVLGKHQANNEEVIRVYLPHAKHVKLKDYNISFTSSYHNGFFEARFVQNQINTPYKIIWEDLYGNEFIQYDPYCFPAQLSDYDLYLFNEGTHHQAYHFLGAHPWSVAGVTGILFAVWAPSAERVSVIGDFNAWDGRYHPMRSRGNSGVWELFIPELTIGSLYKFEIRNNNGSLHIKTDPYGQHFELRPQNAALVKDHSSYRWQDQIWLNKRRVFNWNASPIVIYEVHLGSFIRSSEGGFLPYRDLARRLVPYVKSLGFTHIELLPVTEHLLDESWGYQTTGYFAPTSRFGEPDDFRFFVDFCHQHNIGVILDWVPGHFPKDTIALAQFDGSYLYEHEDPRLGEHKDWGTLIFNYDRSEVKSFLLSSAFYWMKEFHIDGLRVDAVASMLYLDYSRNEGEWVANQYGGNENLGAIDFIKSLNILIHSEFPGTMVIAEESTAWPQVSRPTEYGGLGFSMKWNMGWMHDTLEYFKKDPLYRNYHHSHLSFGMLYAYTENFVLPFSHDEVVHGKGSLLQRMPGDEWQRFANLRLLYSYLFTYPGKKLLFMGSEFGQSYEWNSHQSIDWPQSEYYLHQGIKKLIINIAHIYQQYPALYSEDFNSEGFSWIDCNDYNRSILSYIRKSKSQTMLIVLNFTPTTYTEFCLGVPAYAQGYYREIFNSDAKEYGGEDFTNTGAFHSIEQECMGYPSRLNLTLPPLAAIILLKDN